MNSFLSVTFAVVCAVAAVSGDVSHLPEVKNQYPVPSSTVSPVAYTPVPGYKAQYSPSPVISNRGVIGQQTPTVYSAAAPAYSAAAPAYNQISSYPYSGFPGSSAYSTYGSPLSAYSGAYPSAYPAGAYPSAFSAGSYPAGFSAGAYPSVYSAGSYPSVYSAGSYSAAYPASVSQYPASVSQYPAYPSAGSVPQYSAVSSYPSYPSSSYPASSYPASSYPASSYPGSSYPSSSYPSGSYPSQYPAQYPAAAGGYFPSEISQVSGQYTQTQTSGVKPYANQPAYNNGQYNKQPAYSANQQTTSTPAY